MSDGKDDSDNEVETKKPKGNKDDVIVNSLAKANVLRQMPSINFIQYYFTLGKLTDALPIFKELLTKDKDNVGALLGKGACLQGLGLTQGITQFQSF